MPANDNIASAQVITGLSGSTTGDNTGAGLEANEGALLYSGSSPLGYGGGCSVWYSWTPSVSGTATFTTSAAGGSPIGDSVLSVIDGSNFATASVITQNDDSVGLYSQVSFAAVAGTTYYIAVDGYSGNTGPWPSGGVAQGGFTLTWSLSEGQPIISSFTPTSGAAGDSIVIAGSYFTGVSAVYFNGIAASFVVDSNIQITAVVPSGSVGGLITATNATGTGSSSTPFMGIHICNAEPGANLASSTVSVDASTPAFVKDVQYRVVDDTISSFKADVDYTKSFSIDTAACELDSGYYDVDLYSKFGGTTTTNRIAIQVWRNGVPIGPTLEDGNNGEGNGTAAWRRITGAPISPGAKQGPQKIGFNSGDTLHFHYGQWDVAPSGRRFMEVQKVKFTPISLGSVPGVPPVATGNVPDVGATAGSPMFNLRDHGGVTGDTTDSSAFDFVVMPDDITIYSLMLENNEGYTNNYLSLKKWDGAVWTILSADVWGRGNPSTTHRCWGGISIDTDGTDLWMTWHENTTATGKSVWRCMKYSVGAATFTELGTGQHHFNDTGSLGVSQDAGESGVLLKVGPDGKVWVSFAETDSDSTTTSHNYPFLYYWNGSAWVDTALPFLTYRRNIDPHVCSVNTVEEFNLNHVAFTFCHHDGPSNYPAVIYQADWLGADVDGDPIILEFIYQEYSGSSWGNLVRFIPETVWTGLFANLGHGNWHEGFGLTDDGKVPYLFAQLGWFINASDHVIVGKMKPDGSAFDPVGAGFPDQELSQYYGDTWSYALNGVGGVISGVPILVCKAFDGWGNGHAIISKGENGTGTGWQKAKEHVDEWGEDFDCASVAKVFNKSIYHMISSYGNANYFLGVWKFDLAIGGAISFNALKQFRPGGIVSLR
jgi:hypothetical protein